MSAELCRKYVEAVAKGDKVGLSDRADAVNYVLTSGDTSLRDEVFKGIFKEAKSQGTAKPTSGSLPPNLFEDFLTQDLWIKESDLPTKTFQKGELLVKSNGTPAGIVLQDISVTKDSHIDLKVRSLAEVLKQKIESAHKFLAYDSAAVCSEFVKFVESRYHKLFNSQSLELIKQTCTLTTRELFHMFSESNGEPNTLGRPDIEIDPDLENGSVFLFTVLCMILDHLILRILPLCADQERPNSGFTHDKFASFTGLPHLAFTTYNFLTKSFGLRTLCAHGGILFYELCPSNISYLMYIFLQVCEYASGVGISEISWTKNYNGLYFADRFSDQKMDTTMKVAHFQITSADVGHDFVMSIKAPLPVDRDLQRALSDYRAIFPPPPHESINLDGAITRMERYQDHDDVKGILCLIELKVRKYQKLGDIEILNSCIPLLDAAAERIYKSNFGHSLHDIAWYYENRGDVHALRAKKYSILEERESCIMCYESAVCLLRGDKEAMQMQSVGNKLFYQTNTEVVRSLSMFEFTLREKIAYKLFLVMVSAFAAFKNGHYLLSVSIAFPLIEILARQVCEKKGFVTVQPSKATGVGMEYLPFEEVVGAQLVRLLTDEMSTFTSAQVDIVKNLFVKDQTVSVGLRNYVQHGYFADMSKEAAGSIMLFLDTFFEYAASALWSRYIPDVVREAVIEEQKNAPATKLNFMKNKLKEDMTSCSNILNGVDFSTLTQNDIITLQSTWKQIKSSLQNFAKNSPENAKKLFNACTNKLLQNPMALPPICKDPAWRTTTEGKNSNKKQQALLELLEKLG